MESTGKKIAIPLERNGEINKMRVSANEQKFTRLGNSTVLSDDHDAEAEVLRSLTPQYRELEDGVY